MDEFVEDIIDKEINDPELRSLIKELIDWEEDNLHEDKPQAIKQFRRRINEFLGESIEN